MFSGNDLSPSLTQQTGSLRQDSDMTLLNNELTSRNVPADFQQDFIAIFHFLRNLDDFLRQLDALEKALQAYTTSSPIADKIPKNTHGLFHLPEPKNPDRKNHKLLSGYLYSWAKQQGFMHRAKIFSILSPDAFCLLLHEKSLLKDATPALSSRHGIWSHTIQWWCIFERNKQTPFLQHTAMALYQRFGIEHQAIWDIILDQGSIPHIPNQHFVCPENITGAICGEQERWPLLSTTLHRQLYRQNFNPHYKHPYAQHIRDKHAADLPTGYVKTPL